MGNRLSGNINVIDIFDSDVFELNFLHHFPNKNKNRRAIKYKLTVHKSIASDIAARH